MVMHYDSDDQDPFLTAMLERRKVKLHTGDYHPMSAASTAAGLERLFRAKGGAGLRASDVRRMAGGASKEQFLFSLIDDVAGTSETLVLRMDPIDGVLETSREREYEVVAAMRGVVPVPEVRFLDADGAHLGAPGMVTSFVRGTTKPTDGASGVTGLGTGMSAAWRARLSPQFIDLLATIHGFEFRNAALPHFGIPDADPRQTARWRVNLWSYMWRECAREPMPIFAVTEAWLRRNLPACSELVLLHGDFRTGNYLFDEESGDVTCILDWELAHIGDFHEDLAWSLVEIFGSRAPDGAYLCSSLMTLDDMIASYEVATGRSVDRQILRFYRVLHLYSVIAMCATGLNAAAAHHSHQDILLTWLSMVVPSLVDELTRVLSEEDAS